MKRIIFYLFIFTIISCDKTYVSNIPDFPVDMELHLTFEDNDLAGVPSYKIFTQKNYNQYIRAVGFGGVLVYHGIDGSGTDGYFAFDLSCPHEANRNIHIEVEESNLTAVCPKCGSIFELFHGIGNPTSGPANEDGYYLKSYPVNHTGDKLYIQKW